MNFQCDPVYLPLRVLVINPLCEAALLTITKIMSGIVFGKEQLIDLTLLVYANERTAAEDLKIEDADIFCFITNFKNPNSVDFTVINNDQFDVLYLIIKVANSLAKPKQLTEEALEAKVPRNNAIVEEVKPRKPIIMTDGVITMNILRNLTRPSLPDEIFFCPTPLPGIAKVILGDHLKVQPKNINNILAWGANDEVFHVEVVKPLLLNDAVESENYCSEEIIGNEKLRDLGLDYSKFNKSWLKKDFIAKVQAAAAKNPYGSIYRAADFARTLRIVWKTRSVTAEEDLKVYDSVGVISDGSLDTIKGMAYVLPLVFTKDTWKVDTTCKELLQLQQEIIRINKAVLKLKEMLFPYCKRFLEENVKNLAFIPPTSDSSITVLS